ncbi:hypothetical protein [Andreprevotia sp. IGB-42]|uniref:hypothetical protein n=1 Tax=Andreprevotia sp. IGB-42 TaxID=2497473 RepID=UPI00191D1C7D|nr:hypothetical protein [Andreprevotia sp. IGB-42]
MDVLTDGVNEVADFQASQLLGEANYQRLSAPLGRNIPMDDVAMIGTLQRIGNAVDVAPAVRLINNW